MLTALAGLFGFFTSMAPDIFKFFVDRSNREFDLKKAAQDAQLQLTAEAYQARAAEATAYAEQMKALYATYTTSIRWVDALNGTVRPVLAYAFFLLYAVTKLMIYSHLNINLPWSFAEFWGDEDRALLAAVIGFYFGSRGMAKLKAAP
jgi:hypothetical protein